MGSPDGRRSSEWVVVASGDDVYISAAGLGGVLKASLHGSGQWQTAFVREYYDQKPDWLEARTRAMTRWVRPPPFGANVTLAFRVLVPVSELEEWEDAREPSDVSWVVPPDVGIVEFQVWIRTGARRSQDDWPGKTGRGTSFVGELSLGSTDAVLVTYLFEPPSSHIEGQLRLLQHVMSRLDAGYQSRRGAWRPGLRGFAECLLTDGSLAWLEFAEPSNRPLPELTPQETADLAIELVKVKRFTEAIELFNAALDESPTLIGARYNRACALMLSGKVDAARSELEDLAAQENPHVEPMLNYSALLLSQKCNEEAVEVLERAVGLFPRHAATWHNYGTALKRTRGRAAALRAFRRALALDPRDVSTAVEVAKCLIAKGDLEHAAAELQVALGHSTQDGKARELLSRLLIQLGRPDDALAALDAAAWVGATVEGRFMRAWSLAEQGNHAEALEAMDAYLKAGGERGQDAAISKAVWLMHLNLPAAALGACETWLNEPTASGFLCAVAASAALDLGLTERARQLAERAVQLEESSLTAGVLARVLAEVGETEAAHNMATRALELDADNPDAKAVAARSLIHKGNPGEAWALLEAAIDGGWSDVQFFSRDPTVQRVLASGSIPTRLASWLAQ